MPEPLDRAKVASLVRWIADIHCFEMPMFSLEEAIARARTIPMRAVNSLHVPSRDRLPILVRASVWLCGRGGR